MRQLFEPRLVNGPFGDPGLYVDLRDERRALLFDLGDLSPLPPRKLLRLSQVFVSHAHMDHFIGFDGLLRVVLGRKRQLTLFGGPGFIAQVEHKLRAYTWNVVQRYDVELVLDVREIDPQGQGQQARFSSRSGFQRAPGPPFRCDDGVLLDDAWCRVRAAFVDHGVPCLAFVLEEKARPRVAKNRLVAMGLGTGAWLRELKHALQSGAPAHTPIHLRWRDRFGLHEATRSVGDLTTLVLDFTPGVRIGYVTDLCDTEANRRALAALLAGVDRLYIESPFRDADRFQAQRKHHLSTAQAGEIARGLGARAVVPFHFSPRYLGQADALVAEVQAAWSAPAVVPGGQGATGGADIAGPPDSGGADPRTSPADWTRALR